MLSAHGLAILAVALFLVGCLCIGRPCYSGDVVRRGVHAIVQKVHEPNVIFETKYWRVILTDEQTYLGRSIIYLKRPAGDLNELTQDEQDDLFFMMRTLEHAIRNAFDARLFNWGCLMNHGYRIKPYTPMVHWHMRPRYDHPVEFAGRIFIDPNFGSHYHESADSRIPDDVRQKVIAEIRKHLPPS